jgi:hypothetical protein
MRRYVDSRLAAYRSRDDSEVSLDDNAASVALQEQIWAGSLAAARRAESAPQAVQLLPALNEMSGLSTLRMVAVRDHPPLAVFLLLGVLGLMASMLVGYNSAASARRSRLHSPAYAATIALAVYVVLDLEFPRLGLIRIDSADQVLLDLRRSMD